MNIFEKFCKILIINEKKEVHENFLKILGAGEENLFLNDFNKTTIKVGSKQFNFHIVSSFTFEQGTQIIRESNNGNSAIRVVILQTNKENNIDFVKGIKLIFEEKSCVQIILFSDNVDNLYQKVSSKIHDIDRLLIFEKTSAPLEVIQLIHCLCLKFEAMSEAMVKKDELDQLSLERAREIAFREKEFRLIFENANDAICWIDFDSEKIIKYNRAAQKLWEINDDEFINLHKMILFPEHENKNYSELINCKFRTHKTFLEEIEIITKGGSVKPVILTASLTEISDRKIVQGVFRDLTTQKRELRDKENLQKQIFHTSKLASIGTLAAGIAHEINNPMTILKGNMEQLYDYLNEKSVIDEKMKKIFNIKERSIERIVNIINGLRTYARADTDHVNLVNVHSVIEDCVMLLERMYNNNNIFFERDLGAKESKIMGNIGKLQQVFMNLFSNSKDAMSECKEGLIKISSSNENEMLLVRIQDNGSGISKENIDNIFDTFFTTKRAGKGTGLGLSISYEIISSMNGSIDVQSEVNKGAVFTLRFPFKAQKDDHYKSMESIAPNETFSGKILIVDDEEDIRSMLRYIFEKYGLDVDEAKDGEKALGLIKTKDYDIVCTDIMMPEINGLEFIQRAKGLGNTEKTWFVLITGGIVTGFEKETRDLIWKVADGYMTKPFSREKILKLLKKVFPG